MEKLESYIEGQMYKAEEGHNWKANKMKMKFFGDKNDSNFLSISEETFDAILKAINKGGK